MSNAVEASDEQRPYWHMAFACRKCGAQGMILWDRLDRVLSCRRCSSWYRVGRDARLAEISPSEANMQVGVRGSFTEWRQHRLHAPNWAQDWAQRGATLVARPIEWILGMNWPARLALAGGTAALLVAAILCFAGHSAEPIAAALPLPITLADRAPLFAEAWLARDMPQMLRLTDKSHDLQLRQWLGKTPPPAKAAAAKRAERTIEASVERRDPQRAIVAVRIALLTHSGPESELVQHHQWVDRDGAWYLPPQLPPAAVPARRR